MRVIIIAQDGPFTLTSFGNGWGYELAHRDGRSVWLQDDDATQFRDEWNALGRANPDAAIETNLAVLWDIYEPVATTFEQRSV